MKTYAYITLLNVEVFHAYFGTRAARGLSFTPGPATLALMQRYDFIFQPRTGGFSLLGDPSQQQDAFLSYVESVTGNGYFDFEMSVQDNLFYQYTDLPADWVGQMLFSSRTMGSNGQLNLQLQPGSPGMPQGLFTLYFDDVLRCAATGFSVNFSARSTQWQYYVVNRSAIKMDQPGIVDKSGMQLEAGGSVTIASGEQALFFSSGSSLLPLSEVPRYRFDLVNYSQGGSGRGYKTIFKGLPNPDPAYLRTGQVAGNLPSSPMYIYI